METNRVVRIKNLNDKERTFDINTTLAMSSDSIYIYSGTYANINDKDILVDRDCLDAEYRVYSNVESCALVKVPVEFSNLFEENNHVVFLDNKKYAFLKNSNKSNHDQPMKFVRKVSSR